MKKKFLSVAALALAICAGSAKMASAQTTFGIRAGVNFQNINGKDASGDDLSYKLKPGFNAGINAEVPVATDFYVQPGLLYSMKGAKMDDDANTKVNLSYLEIPINFLYKPMLGSGKLLLGLGPYVAFGVGGTVKSDNGDVDIEFKNEVDAADLTSGNVYARRFDAGANFLAGYEFSNRFSFQLNAQLGLVKINPDYSGIDDGDASWKNTGFGVSLGYRFGQ